MTVIYRGPSLLDGKPIVVIATVTNTNSKTGAMVQTYIIRSDMAPTLANKTGADFSICGNCPHRGIPSLDPKRKTAERRTCYVNFATGLSVVWKAFARGVYPDVRGHAAIAAIGKGRKVRLGTYGDPSAVPSYIWESLLIEAAGRTGYSHQAHVAGADFRPDLLMQSVDSLDEAKNAWTRGYRTFRVVASTTDIVKGKEILCPASKEAGKRTTCVDCMLCGGSTVQAKSIAIPAHGAGAGNFAA